MQPRDNPLRRRMATDTLGARTLAIILISGAIAATGAILRIACVGRACPEPVGATSDVPFCGSPPATRELVSAGFREGRSPNILAVTNRPIGSPTAGMGSVAWPQVGIPPERLPLVLSGPAFASGSELPPGVTLDRIAPTVAAAMGIRRAHPEVRSGEAIEGATTGVVPRLTVLIVLKGVSANDAITMDPVAGLIERGSATQEAVAGSVPSDPAALLTTIGTGGLPRQHGITGSLLRNESGGLAQAWGPRAPVSVIAALGDDLDEVTQQRAQVGMVAAHRTDRGLIGSDWYIEHDRDPFTVVRADDAPRAVREMLKGGFGNDDVPDLLAVTLAGNLDVLADSLRNIFDITNLSPGSTSYVLTTTGGGAQEGSFSAREIEAAAVQAIGSPVVEASIPGGFFVDQEVVAEEQVAEDDIIGVLSRLELGGHRVFRDVFPAIAVSFERYC